MNDSSLISLNQLPQIPFHHRPIPSLSATWIEIPSLDSRCQRAGQHIHVRIFSSGLGWLGWTESHPFTIASAPVTSSKQGRTVGEEGLILVCKKAGGWTGKLYDMARKSGLYRSGHCGWRRYRKDGGYDDRRAVQWTGSCDIRFILGCP